MRRSLALQVRDDLVDMIDAGRLQPGEQLPSETELALRFDVARTTVREALKLLEQDGLITVQHGIGRFVAPTGVERPITRLESVTEMMESLGYVVSNRVLAVGESPATGDEAAALRLAAGQKVVRLERLRFRAADPLIYSVDVLPRHLCPADLADIDWSGSLDDALASLGLRLATATAEIRAVTLPAGVRRAIGIVSSAPWLLLIQTNFTGDGRPVVYSHDYHRGDVFKFNVLRRRSGATT